ncbi:hypothetical protein Y032_0651g1142 [Ancylostoma ceylanicum]|uniref:Uncharacterized protein n=1 Tax=Ancylostoma ceylanicum TaxID=53326 RepID=A0A016WJ02_9BILA|nr:hypothetical protein Y032_0651g1142 [Ancylostoma ceylanicum]
MSAAGQILETTSIAVLAKSDPSSIFVVVGFPLKLERINTFEFRRVLLEQNVDIDGYERNLPRQAAGKTETTSQSTEKVKSGENTAATDKTKSGEAAKSTEQAKLGETTKSTDKVKPAETSATGTSAEKQKSVESTKSSTASKAASEKGSALSKKTVNEESAKRRKEVLRRQTLMALIGVTWLVFLGSFLCVILVLSRFSSESKAYVFSNVLWSSQTFVDYFFHFSFTTYLFYCGPYNSQYTAPVLTAPTFEGRKFKVFRIKSDAAYS